MKTTARSLIMSVALLGAAALSGVAAATEVYTWTDENGVVHFSDQEPVGQEATVESLPDSAPPASPNPYADNPSGPSAAQQRREEIAQRGREAQAQEAMTAQKCSAWQAEVDRLEPSRRVFQTNDKGETERMDDVARTDRVAELKSLIARNCR